MIAARLLSALLLAAAGLLAAPASRAQQTYPVDDSGSQVIGNNVRMKWDSVVPRPGQVSTVTGHLTVLVRLDVSPWRGRQARIYQTLPAQPGGPVTARWSSRGTLLAGQLRDGERALVYAGPILSDRLEDTFRLTIQADGDRLVRTEQLRFSFEIELESP